MVSLISVAVATRLTTAMPAPSTMLPAPPLPPLAAGKVFPAVPALPPLPPLPPRRTLRLTSGLLGSPEKPPTVLLTMVSWVLSVVEGCPQPSAKPPPATKPALPPLPPGTPLAVVPLPPMPPALPNKVLPASVTPETESVLTAEELLLLLYTPPPSASPPAPPAA